MSEETKIEEGVVEKALRVSDIIDFSEKDYTNSKLLIKELDRLTLSYAMAEDSVDVEGLDLIKRQIGGYMTSLSTIYAKIRGVRENFEYLESSRKQIKSDAIKLIIKREGMSAAAAEKLVYSEEYYKSRVNLLSDLRKHFYLVELRYERYEKALLHIFQSISLLSKEREYTQKIG